MKRVCVLVLLMIAGVLCESSHAYAWPYARISNMSLDIRIEYGDYAPPGPDPYPRWWSMLAPSSYPWTFAETLNYVITPTPGTGARPYITGGGNSGGFWVDFDRASKAGSVASGRVLGVYYMSKFRTTFDYNISGLGPDLQLQIWINRASSDVLVWNSTEYYQSGHVSIERDVMVDPYASYKFVVAAPVPEPMGLATLACGASALFCMLRSRRR